MSYFIDLESITLDKYRSKLISGYLPPSRQILREKIKDRFNHLKSLEIANAKELLIYLKQKSNIIELSKTDLFTEDYLIILLRELKSTLPKPNRIKDFTGISLDTINRLEQAGIKNTVKLFDRIKTANQRQELSNSSGISEKEILELTKLTDLSRIRWAGVTFARMLYTIGVDTVEKVSKADPDILHKKINEINKEKGYYKGHIGLNDIHIFVAAAKEVPIAIDYKSVRPKV